MASQSAVPVRCVAAVLLAAAGCGVAPRSVALHYAAREPGLWTAVGADRLTTSAFGAELAVVLARTEPGLELEVANPTDSVLEVRVGPEATRSRVEPIGELQHRRLDGASGEGNSDFLPYLPRQPIQVQPATRTVFSLDRVLGREPAVGQYLVLVVEVQAPGGARQRRLLPLQVVADPVRSPAR